MIRLAIFLLSLGLVVCVQYHPDTPLPTRLPIGHYDMRIFLFRFFQYINEVNVSAECRSATGYFQQHQNEDWAVKMIDSNSIIEPGLSEGNFQFFGSFDQCIGLKMPESMNSNLTHSIQYCSIGFPVNLILTPNETEYFPPFLLQLLPSTAGLCLPSACNSRDDIPIILREFELKHNLSNSLQLAECVTKDRLLFVNRATTTHFVIITIFSILILMALIGTAVEWYVAPNDNESFRKLNWFYKVLICFSLERNLSFLFHALPLKKKTKTNNEVINLKSTSSKSKLRPPVIHCLHGVRVLSFVFILIYHIFTEAETPSYNLLQVVNAEKQFLKQLVTNAAIWVDTFLLISGFLVAHSILYSSGTRRTIGAQLRNHPKRLLHRYIRLTPSVAGVLLLSILVEPLGSGPIWYQYVQQSQMTCHNNWWPLFAYVNNFFKLNQLNQMPTECQPHLWYLAVDMQFFLISPLLIMCLTNERFRVQMFGVVINILVIAASWIATAVLMAVNGLTPTVLVTVYDLKYINLIYKSPFCRIAPYCIGILLAYFLRRKKISESENPLIESESKQLSNWKVGIVQLSISILLMLAVTLLTYPWLQGVSYKNAPSVLYGAVHRAVWAFAWALFVWCAAQNHLPLLNRIFALNLFQLLSKLTYQAYLLHPVLIAAVVKSVRQKIYYSDLNLILNSFQYFILTMLCSVGMLVMFEKPFMNLEQAFLRQL